MSLSVCVTRVFDNGGLAFAHNGLLAALKQQRLGRMRGYHQVDRRGWQVLCGEAMGLTQRQGHAPGFKQPDVGDFFMAGIQRLTKAPCAS